MNGDTVTVGGDHLCGVGGSQTIRADDTGQIWTITDRAGLGDLFTCSGVPRAVVRGVESAPYTLGRVEAWGKYSAGERGTTIIVKAGTPAETPSTVLPPSQVDAIFRNLEQAYSEGVSDKYPVRLNQTYLGQMMAEVDRRLAAGQINAAQAADYKRQLPVGPPRAEDGYYLPAGVTAVPIMLQGSGVTVTGQVNPSAFSPEEIENTRLILAETARQRGTTVTSELQRLAERTQDQLTYKGVLAPTQAADAYFQTLLGVRDSPVQREIDELNTTFTVDERSDAAEHAAYRASVGIGSPVAGAASTLKDVAAGIVKTSNMNPWLLAGLAAVGVFVVTRKGGH